MGVVNLKPAEYEQRWQKNLIACNIQSSTSHERSCNLNFFYYSEYLAWLHSYNWTTGAPKRSTLINIDHDDVDWVVYLFSNVFYVILDICSQRVSIYCCNLLALLTEVWSHWTFVALSFAAPSLLMQSRHQSDPHRTPFFSLLHFIRQCHYCIIFVMSFCQDKCISTIKSLILFNIACTVCCHCHIKEPATVAQVLSEKWKASITPVQQQWVGVWFT